MSSSEAMTDPQTVALRKAREMRAAQEQQMGWPEADWRAFLTGERDHWPSMQEAVRALLEKERVG